MSFFKEFRDFAMRGNVVDLAVGVIIGAAFGKIVSSLVANIIMPPLGLLIGGVVDREITAEADVVGFATQQPRTQRVEGGNPHGAAVGIEQPLDPLAHFLRGLVGERDRHDLIGIRNALRHEIGDAVRDDARLSRAGSCQNQQRTFCLAYSLLLFGIQ